MRTNLIVLCCVVFTLIGGFTKGVRAESISREMFVASIIADVESSCDDNAPPGDHGKSFGPLQIHEEVCIDVNRRFGTDFHAVDCQGNFPLSEEIFWRYMSIYATPERLGREPSCEDYARIWNGGPNGCFNNGAVNKNGGLARNLKTRAKIAAVQRQAKEGYWKAKVLPRLQQFFAERSQSHGT